MIFTLIITCFLGLGALQPSCAAPRLNENQVVESKKRNNLINNGTGYIMFTTEDMYDTQFLTNLIGRWSTLNYNDAVVNSVSYVYSWDDVRAVDWGYSNINVNASDFGYSNFPANTGYPSITISGKSFNNNFYFIDYDIVIGYVYNLGSFTDFTCHVNYIIPRTTSSAFGGSFGLISFNIFRLVFVTNNSYVKSFFDDSNNDFNVGYQQGYTNGYNSGYSVGIDEGYEQGEIHGKDIAQDPSSEIYQNTYDTGYTAGQQAGYTEGYTSASSDSGVPAIIFSGILSVALIPVNAFIQMFQYDVFGINIAGLVSSLITIAMVIIIVRFLLGGKTDDK